MCNHKNRTIDNFYIKNSLYSISFNRGIFWTVSLFSRIFCIFVGVFARTVFLTGASPRAGLAFLAGAFSGAGFAFFGCEVDDRAATLLFLLGFVHKGRT